MNGASIFTALLGIALATVSWAAPMRVFVSVPPQVEFVERIGGERVSAEALAGPGQSPHTLDPTPRQVARLAEAALFIRVGMPFEEGLIGKLASLSETLRIVDQRAGLTLRPQDGARDEPAHEEREGQDGHEHEAGELDPHIWLSPKLATTQADTIARALIQADPEGRGVYEANLARFVAELEAVDREIGASLENLPTREFFVFHPALGYFADAYGLKQVAVESEGKQPGARRLARLIDRAKARGVKMIFVQPQFSAKAARTLADAIGGAVVPLDPLSPEYLNNLKRIGEELARALGTEQGR